MSLSSKLQNHKLEGVQIRRYDGARNLLYPAPGYHYKVRLDQKTTAAGFADLALYTVDQLFDRPRIHSAAITHGLFLNDRLAEIVNFYPHGRDTEGKEEVCFRKGIGSVLYEQLLKDVHRCGAAGIFAHVTSVEMENFLSKRQFRPVSDGSSVYLKIPA